MSYDIQLGRVYEPAQETDGARVLVDRLWPRGKKRDELLLMEWGPDIAPSAALRRAWHKGYIDELAFIQRYLDELDANRDKLLPLMRYARQGSLKLLTASREPRYSHLPPLRRALLNALDKEDSEADGCEPSSPTCYLQSIE